MSMSMDLPLTPAEIVERLGDPIVERDGRWYCPVCEHSADHPRIGPHMVVHWREVGVVNAYQPKSRDTVECPECTYRGTRGNLIAHLVTQHGVEQRVACARARVLGFDLDATLKRQAEHPIPNTRREPERPESDHECPLCDFSSSNHGAYGSHLRKRHGITDPGQRQTMWDRGAPEDVPDGLVRYDDDGTERSVVALVPTAPTVDGTDAALAIIMSQANGSIPTSMLPDLIAWVDDTRDLVERLRGIEA